MKRATLHWDASSVRKLMWRVVLLLLITSLPTAAANHVDRFEVIWVLWENEIPAVYSPQFTRQNYLSPEEDIIGVYLGGEARAYPIKIMNWHEVVNDVVGGVPIAITYCPLCGTGIVFSRVVEDEELTFGVSGRLYKSNLVMFDNETESLWSQITGEAILGPLHGRRLQWVFSLTLYWSDWKEQHPDSLILMPPLPQCAGGRTGDECRDYTVDPYMGYRLSTVVYSDFGGEYRDTILHPKTTILGIEIGGVAMAYPLIVLEETQVLHDVLNRQQILATFVNGSAQAFDPGGRRFMPFEEGAMKDDEGAVWNRLTGESLSGQKLQPLKTTRAMWFAWAQFQPGSGVYSLRPPSVLTFALSTTPSTVAKGEVLFQDVHLNNTSSLALEEVTIRVNLPQALEYVTDDAPSSSGYYLRSEEGSVLSYVFESISPGTHTFRITTMLKAEGLQGTIFKSTISIEYRDTEGRTISASRQGETFEVVEREPRSLSPLLSLLPLGAIPVIGWWFFRRRRLEAPEND